jgi:hypothetical protein
MSVTVRVDLNSAVVTYRPAAGEERSVTAQKATPNADGPGRPPRQGSDPYLDMIAATNPDPALLDIGHQDTLSFWPWTPS